MRRRAVVVVLAVFWPVFGGACAVSPTDPENLVIPNVEPNQAGDDSGGGGSRADGGTQNQDSSRGGGDSSSGNDASQSNDTSVDTGSSSCVKVAPNNLCGLVPQCGCGGAQTCDVTNDTTGATSCVTSGATPQGSRCTGTGNCALGLTCVFGACRPYCTTPNQPCNGAGLGGCYAPEYAAGLTTPNRNVCALTCDPRSPAGACGNNSCLWFAGSNGGDCRPSGALTEFDVCSTLDACSPALTCFNHPLFGPECERWCRLPAANYPGDCGMLTTCTDAYGAIAANAPVIGGVKLGLCQ